MERDYSDSVLKDLVRGARMYPVWGRLGWNDVAARYRRTALGPIWIFLAVAITVAGLGTVWSIIFGMSIETFFPYLTAGIIAWSFLSIGVIEGSCTFTGNAGLIKGRALPLSLHAYRQMLRNLIAFAHGLLVYIVVAFIFGLKPTVATLLFVPSLCILMVNYLWVAMLLGLVCSRHRDITPLITSLMTVAFLLTPVMWKPEMLGDRAFLAQFNPFTHFLTIIRDPLLGQFPSPTSWMVTIGFTLVGWIVAVLALRRYRHMIPFWV